MMETFAMSGYGIYVWSTFALTATVLVYNEWAARRRFRAVYRDIEVRIKALENRP